MAAYLIAQIEVLDPAGFEEYRSQVPALFKKHGARLLVRGGEVETIEGEWDPGRLLVWEFPSKEDITRLFESEEYAPLHALRKRSANTIVSIVKGV